MEVIKRLRSLEEIFKHCNANMMTARREGWRKKNNNNTTYLVKRVFFTHNKYIYFLFANLFRSLKCD